MLTKNEIHFFIVTLLFFFLIFHFSTNFSQINIESNNLPIKEAASPSNSKNNPQISSNVRSPTILTIEFDDPYYPNHTQVFVNMTFTIKVKFSASLFNYTDVEATLTLDASPTDQNLFFVNETDNTVINDTRSVTKTLGSLTTKTNKTLSWKAIPYYYNPTEFSRLVRVNATGLRSGIVAIKTPMKYLNVDINYPILSIEGPKVEYAGEIAYFIKYKETKTLQMNITSSGNYPLKNLKINITSDDALQVETTSAIIVASLDPSSSFIFNFTIKAISKEKVNSTLIIEISSDVTPVQRTELKITALKAPEKGLISINYFDTIGIILASFLLLGLRRRGKN
ncbi:MAG: hypothetical protein ACFFCQ_16540 [Promethearchaeota archaeon]